MVDHMGDVGLADLSPEERHLTVRKPRLRPTAQVQDDLDELLLVGQLVDGRDHLLGQGREEQVQVVHRFSTVLRRCHCASLETGHPVALLVRVLIRGYTRLPCHVTCPQRTAGTRAGSATRTRVSFMSSVTVAIAVKPWSSRTRS